MVEPEDDAFVRTAIRGMRPPEHHETFWDRLAGDLDAAEDAGARGITATPAPQPAAAPARPRRAARADHPPRRAPLHAAPPQQVVVDTPAGAAPAAAPPATPAAPPSVPAMLAAAAKAPPPGGTPPPRSRTGGRQAGGIRPNAPGLRKVDPLAGLRVRHDASTMPASMRRTANVVLLTVALAAILIVLIAGISLVRSRSDSSAPPAPPTPSTGRSTAAHAPADPGGDLAAVAVQTR
jgi:hypothetical protein